VAGEEIAGAYYMEMRDNTIDSAWIFSINQTAGEKSGRHGKRRLSVEARPAGLSSPVLKR